MRKNLHNSNQLLASAFAQGIVLSSRQSGGAMPKLLAKALIAKAKKPNNDGVAQGFETVFDGGLEREKLYCLICNFPAIENENILDCPICSTEHNPSQTFTTQKLDNCNRCSLPFSDTSLNKNKFALTPAKKFAGFRLIERKVKSRLNYRSHPIGRLAKKSTQDLIILAENEAKIHTCECWTEERKSYQSGLKGPRKSISTSFHTSPKFLKVLAERELKLATKKLESIIRILAFRALSRKDARKLKQERFCLGKFLQIQNLEAYSKAILARDNFKKVISENNIVFVAKPTTCQNSKNDVRDAPAPDTFAPDTFNYSIESAKPKIHFNRYAKLLNDSEFRMEKHY